MAEAAYDADHFRQTIADKGALAAILTIPRAPESIRWTNTSTPSAVSSNAAPQISFAKAAPVSFVARHRRAIEDMPLEPPFR
jgi:hypothetical protein